MSYMAQFPIITADTPAWEVERQRKAAELARREPWYIAAYRARIERAGVVPDAATAASVGAVLADRAAGR